MIGRTFDLERVVRLGGDPKLDRWKLLRETDPSIPFSVRHLRLLGLTSLRALDVRDEPIHCTSTMLTG